MKFVKTEPKVKVGQYKPTWWFDVKDTKRTDCACGIDQWPQFRFVWPSMSLGLQLASEAWTLESCSNSWQRKFLKEVLPVLVACFLENRLQFFGQHSGRLHLGLFPIMLLSSSWLRSSAQLYFLSRFVSMLFSGLGVPILTNIPIFFSSKAASFRRFPCFSPTIFDLL